MYLKFFWTVVRILLFVATPAFFAYLSSEKNIIDVLIAKNILGANINIDLVKQFFLILSVTISNLILVVIYERSLFKRKLLTAKNASLFNDFKISFLSSLATEIENPRVQNLKFRVWRKPNKFIQTINNMFRKKIKTEKLIMIELTGLTDSDTTKGLEFEITPNLQGLVGRCYNTKNIEYEEDISQLNEMYNLTKFQISKTRNTKFCLCVPIFGKNDEVVSILSLDCAEAIQIPESKEQIVADLITLFIQDLNKYFPKLFK